MIKKHIYNMRLFKSVGIYTITSMINSAIPFFLMPILTRYLSPEDYGIVSMFGVIIGVITPLIGLSIHGAIGRVYYEKDTVNIKEYIANSLIIPIFGLLIISSVLFFSSELIIKVFTVPVKIIWAAVIVSFGQVITSVVLTLCQVQIKPIQYGIYQISQTALNMILSVIFVIFVGLTWKGRIYAQLITVLTFIMIGFILLIKKQWLKFRFNYKYLKHALRFGIPLIPHTLGGLILTMTDRVFITHMIGLETTGIYTVGYQIGMIINILAISFNQAYVPWLYAKLKENNMESKIEIVKLTYIYYFLIIIMAVALSIIAPTFLKVFVGKEFNQSSSYVTWIALGYAFNGMYFMVTNYIFYVQKTAYLSIVTFLSAILNVGLNYIFIRKFGAIGAAQSTTIIYLFKFILTWILSAKVYKMPWNIVGVKN